MGGPDGLHVRSIIMIGVYRIVNIVTGRTYIGSAVDVEIRLATHKHLLAAGRHHNTYLQRSWVKYGAEMFRFEPLVECQLDERKLREQRFIDAYLSHDLLLYNVRPSADSREGFKYVMSPQSRLKMSAAQKGKTIPLAVREKISRARIGTKLSAGTRARMCVAQKGRYVSPATCEKIRLSKTGVKWSAARRLAYEASRG